MNGRPRTTNHEQIRKEIEEGHTASEIAERLKICTGQVYKVAKSFGISVSPPPKYENPLWKEIVQRVQETGNGYQTDIEFGLSPGSSKRICRTLGAYYPERYGRMKENLSREQLIEKHPDWEDFVSLYMTGKSQRAIASLYGISDGTVGRALKLLGVQLESGGRPQKTKKFLPDNLPELYNSGLPCKEIGQMFGVDSEVVRDRLIQLGVPRRIGKASGNKNPQWKGGRTDTMHYYRRQAYEVGAICLGKPVPKGHIIHHIDENPQNNTPRNLITFESQGLHAKFHQTALKNRLTAGSEEAILLALEIGGVPLPEPAYPIEL
jgi:hypothetical protein